MSDYPQILIDIETHNVSGIQHYFKNGGSPNDVLNNLPLFTTMVEMYSRGPKFHFCIQAFINAGLQFEDEALLAVLADDAIKLENIL
ncbi:hypothetical protein HDC92_005035, partial [Pedobacter sp. AK017]|nr:hypothetical protein [Pedobacter sp. AK017]